MSALVLSPPTVMARIGASIASAVMARRVRATSCGTDAGMGGAETPRTHQDKLLGMGDVCPFVMPVPGLDPWINPATPTTAGVRGDPRVKPGDDDEGAGVDDEGSGADVANEHYS